MIYNINLICITYITCSRKNLIFEMAIDILNKEHTYKLHAQILKSIFLTENS